MITNGRLSRYTALLLLLPILGPTVIVLVSSFSAGQVLTFPPRGFTTRWYSEMLSNDAVWSALGSSLHVSLVSVLLNVVCAVPAGLALPRVGRNSRAVFTVLLSLGLSSPTIVSAFAYFNLYQRLGLGGSLNGVGLAIAVTCFPFMLWTVLAAIEDQDEDLTAAAATMGADSVEQFLFVRLPLLAPAMVTGALIVFVLASPTS